MIDQLTVSKIFDAMEITEVVSDFVTLKKRGVNHLGLCPFHNEKTPSFTVSPAKGIYKCFGCGKGGNAVNFIMEHEQLGYVDALKYLAKKYHIELVEKKLSLEQKKQKDDRESMMALNAFAQKTFSHYLHQDQEGVAIGMSYLKERGFSDAMAKKFQLGFCPEAWDAFSKQALEKGYRKEFLVKTGLSIDKGERLFDRFRGRIMFPIHGIAGRVLGFGGRILKKQQKNAKYLNSPESEIYHKSEVLYGIFFAKKSMVQNDKCFLVEGYTDVISLHQAGIENVVASSGTSLTAGQIRMIKRFTNNVSIVFDGDSAGIKASLRGIDLILEQNLNAKVLLLPEGEDPDSFAKKMSASQLISYIEENETDFINFKAKLLLKDSKNDPIKRAKAIRDIVSSVALIPDTIVRSVYIKECSEILNVEERSLHTEVNKIIYRKRFQSHTYSKTPDFKEIHSKQNPVTNKNLRNVANHCDREERALIRLLLNFGQKILFKDQDENGHETTTPVGLYIITELKQDELESEDPLYQSVFNEFEKNMNQEDFNVKRFFRDHENNELARFTADILSEPYRLSGLWFRNGNYLEEEEMKLKEIVPKLVNEYKGKKIRLLIKETLKEIQNAQKTDDSETMRKLMQRKMLLDQIKNEISKKLGNRTII